MLVERSGSAAQATEKSPGTLRTFEGHGVGNPRDRVSGRSTSLLKFQSIEILKGFIEKLLKSRAHERVQLSVEKRQVETVGSSPSDITSNHSVERRAILRVVLPFKA
ncbi:hypothetical protein SAMN04490196_1961 [Pseudomonas moraviensis]|nr:hypothetical protein SAMN04490196_1961 [Pseudomonas moraviensis]